jgi:hypothetical protein
MLGYQNSFNNRLKLRAMAQSPSTVKAMNKLLTVKDLRTLLQLGHTSVNALTAREDFPTPYTVAGPLRF